MYKTAIQLILAVATLTLLVSCSKDQPQTGNQQNPQQQQTAQSQQNQQNQPMNNPHAGAAVNTIAGVSWDIPAGWANAGEKPMRVATYLIDPADPKADCAVYFFGTGQGGDVNANISRWVNQVSQPDGSDSNAKAKHGSVTSDCCEITTVEVDGTYNFSSGPMMQSQEQRPDYILMAGIAPAPQGNVFFKLTGPKANAEKYREAFTKLLKSVKKATV